MIGDYKVVKCLIKWLDDYEEQDVWIAIGKYDSDRVTKYEDENIFFWCKDENDYRKLFDEDANEEDFVIVKEL